MDFSHRLDTQIIVRYNTGKVSIITEIILQDIFSDVQAATLQQTGYYAIQMYYISPHALEMCHFPQLHYYFNYS